MRFGVGHRLQPPGLYGLGGSGDGSGAGLNGNRGRGVPRPRACLAGVGDGLLRLDDGGLGDGDVEEGLEGVVLGGRLCGGGSRWGEGGSRCGGLGPRLEFGLGFGSGQARFCCRRTICGFWGCVGWSW